MSESVPPSLPDQLLYVSITEIGHTEFMWSVSPRLSYAIALAHRSYRVDHVSPTENSNVHFLIWIGLTEFYHSVSPSLGICRFCVESIYTTPPTFHSWREPSERAYTCSIHFLRENHLLMCWDQDIPFQPQESWSLAFPRLLSTQIIFPP